MKTEKTKKKEPSIKQDICIICGKIIKRRNSKHIRIAHKKCWVELDEETKDKILGMWV